MLILGFSDYEAQGRALANALDVEFALADVHRFPDGESRVRIPTDLPAHTVLCRTLDRPNDKLVELMLAARTARCLGARRLTLVAPYLCYMRQDVAFAGGDAVSQSIVGQFLGELFDDVLTVDPHLHRTGTLAEALPNTRPVELTATGLMAEHLRRSAGPKLLVGPDEESRQWVERVAEQAGLPHLIAAKTRRGDRNVSIRVPDMPLTDREIVIIDDVASSGETLATAARALAGRGGGAITAMVSHGVFAPGAVETLASAGIGKVVTSDSVSHASNEMPLAGVLAAGLAEIARRKP